VTISEERRGAVGAEESVVLDGRFRFTRRLGQDTIAEVWQADDLQLDRRVVVRLLHPQLIDDEAVRERFRLEALAAAQLSHGHVANLFDVADDGQRVYTVGEYVDGPSVAALLERGPMQPRVVAAIGRQAASGLAAAHEAGIVHRDVQPGNLLIGRDGRVRIVDFGSARIPDPERQGFVDGDDGAESYLAPEQIEKGAVSTDRSDVYALGRTLMRALTGSRVAPEDNGQGDKGLLSRVIDALPGVSLGEDEYGRLSEHIAAATEPDPARRPSARELADALLDICGHRGEDLLRPLVAELPESMFGRQPC
jgi:eukaryotic-like serine/threonine-protein kinase